MSLDLQFRFHRAGLFLGLTWFAGHEATPPHSRDVVAAFGAGSLRTLRAIFPDAVCRRVVHVDLYLLPFVPLRASLRWLVRQSAE